MCGEGVARRKGEVGSGVVVGGSTRELAVMAPQDEQERAAHVGECVEFMMRALRP